MQCLPCPTLCFCFPAKVQAIGFQIGLHKWWAWYIRASSSHTDNIYYETLDAAALKSLLESVFLSRPRPQRWKHRSLKGVALILLMPGVCFLPQPFVSVWEFLWGTGSCSKWQTAFLSNKWKALPAAGTLVSVEKLTTDPLQSPCWEWLLSSPMWATLTTHKRPVILMPKHCAYGQIPANTQKV